ncbi:glycosyltransferase family 2 protein [Roseovarius sp. Pro17]|uniref:glycosyltransferase family 2 protein n=1 Tax=Roseovarius sp. Pro17 TaxID=3108175 RepID=UPI002D782561|nr:glycosyltransferase [Roseovarius sp. Pro17]
MTKPLTYSIALIAYNQVDWIEEAVKAVLEQECNPLEIILSDDCSTDGTFDAMSRLAAAYQGPHTVVLNRNPVNLGLIGHINRTFELASGEVIISIAGDDICYPNRAARTIEVFEAERPLLAFSQARVETFDGQEMPRNYQKATFYSTYDAKSAAVSMQLYLGATCAWHKDLYRKYGPIKYAECYEDLILGFRAALEGRVALIDEELVLYRVGVGLTNSDIAYTTPEAHSAQRTREVKREVMVLRQRLDDAAVFGLRAGDPILTAIEKRLGDREMRLTYLTGGFSALIQKGWQHPVAILGALLSERRRQKKARRQRA